MDDQQVLSRIDELVREEEALLHRHEGEGGLSPEEDARLAELRVKLDQAWDYLRQRRALPSTARTPTRPASATPPRSSTTKTVPSPLRTKPPNRR